MSRTLRESPASIARASWGFFLPRKIPVSTAPIALPKSLRCFCLIGLGWIPSPASGTPETSPIKPIPSVTDGPAPVGAASSPLGGGTLGLPLGPTGPVGPPSSGSLLGWRSNPICSMNMGWLRKFSTPVRSFSLRLGALAKSSSVARTSPRCAGSARSLPISCSRSFLFVLPIPIWVKSSSETRRSSTSGRPIIASPSGVTVIGSRGAALGCSISVRCNPNGGRASGFSSGAMSSGVGAASNSCRCSLSARRNRALSASVTGWPSSIRCLMAFNLDSSKNVCCSGVRPWGSASGVSPSTTPSPVFWRSISGMSKSRAICSGGAVARPRSSLGNLRSTFWSSDFICSNCGASSSAFFLASARSSSVVARPKSAASLSFSRCKISNVLRNSSASFSACCRRPSSTMDSSRMAYTLSSGVKATGVSSSGNKSNCLASAGTPTCVWVGSVGWVGEDSAPRCLPGMAKSNSPWAIAPTAAPYEACSPTPSISSWLGL